MAMQPRYLSWPGKGSATNPSRKYVLLSAFRPRFVVKYSSAGDPRSAVLYVCVACSKNASRELDSLTKSQALPPLNQRPSVPAHAAREAEEQAGVCVDRRRGRSVFPVERASHGPLAALWDARSPVVFKNPGYVQARGGEAL